MRSDFQGVLVFCTCFLTCCAFSQFDNQFINGVLLDTDTGEPVVFATIRLKGKALGVISNNDGGFKVPLDFQSKGEELIISSMGYATKNIVFSELNKDTINLIFLKSAPFELSEAVVTGERKRKPNAKQIIRYAFERIPDNYYKDAFELAGYYRDYQLKEGEYINLNEALIHVFDKGFEIDDYTSTRFGLYDYVKNTGFVRDSFAAKRYDYSNWDKYIPDARLYGNYSGNELVLLFIHDAIRNHNVPAYSFVNTLVEDFIKEHSFLDVKHTTYDDQAVYQIEFKKNSIPFQVRGTIYIDKDDYAIRKLDYAVHKQKELDDTTSRFKYSTVNMDLIYEILVEYRDFDDRMYLNYISFHNQFKLIRPPKFFIAYASLNLGQREKKEILTRPGTDLNLKLDLRLNKPAANWQDLRPKDFGVFFKGKKFDIDSVSQTGSSTYVLQFSQKTKAQQKALSELLLKSNDYAKDHLMIEVKKMVDAEGNVLGHRESELLDQFREFFTQKVITTKAAQTKSKASFLNKTKSLGEPSQPKMYLELKQEFWMNSPLKNLD